MSKHDDLLRIDPRVMSYRAPRPIHETTLAEPPMHETTLAEPPMHETTLAV
jgi:hypothetical protein